MTWSYLPARVAAGAVLVAGISILGASPAQAHVTVRPDSTAPGSFSALTFRVPNESDTAGTVKLTVRVPEDAPLLYVSTKPVPGWRVQVTKAKLAEPVTSHGTTITEAVSTVTWTATGETQIAPGEYQEFPISAGPLPESGTVVLPAEQTYSDGTVVDWDQPVPVSGEEPEHPAPAFEIAAAEPVASASSAPSTPGSPPADAASVDAGDPVARWLGGAALALGAVGVVLGGLGFRRSRTPG